MKITNTDLIEATGQVPANKTVFRVLCAVSFSHFLNDLMQSLMLSIYPLFKTEFQLSLAQIGLITLAYQLTASLLQPFIGNYTDSHPKPYSLAFGMGCTFFGLLVLSIASSFPLVLIAASMVGTGSSIFHPESSRVARMASGGQHGLAQSIFQVGGNTGAAVGPLRCLVRASKWSAQHRMGLSNSTVCNRRADWRGAVVSTSAPYAQE
jgi:FSR family fosmidomycin resistance protein-like MFS transporter